MATEPAAKFQYGIPEAGTPAASQEVRDNFEALARNFFTSDPSVPENPRAYQTRILNDVNDPVQAGNHRLQAYIGGAWRDVLQHIEGGVAAPAKVFAEFNSPAPVWTVDHNRGSKPLPLVFDSTWNQFAPIHTLRREVLYFGRTDHALVAPGPVARLPVQFEGRILEVYGVSPNGSTPAGGDIYQWEIDSTASGGAVVPVTGGALTLPTPVPPGTIVPGSLPTGSNIFSRQGGGGSEDVLQVTASPVGPGTGAIDLYAVVEQSLQPGQYALQHINDNRFIVTFNAATTGFIILVG